MIKKTILALALTTTTTLASANSYQYGTPSEISVEHESATFQINTTNGVDNRDSCTPETLTWRIDVTKPAGLVLLDIVREAKKNGDTIGVNGDGVCNFNESEGVGVIAY